MPPVPLTLFELFGRDPSDVWPSAAVRQHTGDPVDGPPDPSAWLGALNNSVKVANVRTGALGDRVAVEADLTVDPLAGFLGYPEGWPFVIASLVDVEFRIQPYAAPTQPEKATKLFASAGDNGFELVLEGLPVEIRLPAGLVQPHPDDEGDPSGGLVVERGSFEPGRLDDLKVTYRRGEPTSIFVHLRLYVSETYEVHVQPAVPISFERCSLSGIPCKAVHDFRLIPSPELAFQQVRQEGDDLDDLPPDDPRPGSYEWLRHRIDPWLPSHTGPFDGLFSVRSVDIDEEAEGLQDAVEWLNGHTKDTDPTADFVLGDLVVPFRGPFWLPVPRHLTAGIRRKVLDPGSKNEVFAFERAPVHLFLCEDHRVAFNLESLFYRSLPVTSELLEDSGLTFSAAVVFGDDVSPQHAFEIGVAEENTVVVGYKRDFSSTDGTPIPGTGAQGAINAILHWEIGGAVILDIMSFRLGLSIGRKFFGEKSWADSTLATADVFVSMPPTGSDQSTFRLRALNGEKVEFTMEGIGWRLGSVNLKGLALPDGVVAYISNFALVISEVGLLAEEGASYLSFSGGLLIELPSGLEGGATVKRLRFRVAGNEARPGVRMDGFFLFARNRDASVALEAGGYYTEEKTDEAETREFAFAGAVSWKAGTSSYKLGLDVLVGDRRDAEGELDYFMFQAYFKATIGPLGAWEFTGARILFARNMLPKLSAVDLESRELRYYNWYKGQNNPLTVPADRRLAAWRPERDAWALGVGASGSLPAFGKVVELSLFLLGIKGDSEKGLLVAAEVFALSNKRPLGYAVVEIDRTNDRTSVLVGVDARASSFVKDAPGLDGRHRHVHRHALRLERSRHVRDRTPRGSGDVASAPLRRRPLARSRRCHRLLPRAGRGRPEGLRPLRARRGRHWQERCDPAHVQRRLERGRARLHDRLVGLRRRDHDRGRDPVHALRLSASRRQRADGLPGRRRRPGARRADRGDPARDAVVPARRHVAARRAVRRARSRAAVAPRCPPSGAQAPWSRGRYASCRRTSSASIRPGTARASRPCTRSSRCAPPRVPRQNGWQTWRQTPSCARSPPTRRSGSPGASP